MVEIKSINELLIMKLDIPNYQRPYKWDIHNINDLLSDIWTAIDDAERYGKDFRYRIGTIILYHNCNRQVYEVVDGQQRILSLLLFKCCIDPKFTCHIFRKKFNSKITQDHLYKNYKRIRETLQVKNDDDKEKLKNALDKILQVVVVYVDKITEAFQLFDSQNTRGKELDPHDLLKAYHLRAMRGYPYEMAHAVTKWEAKNTKEIRELLDLYLFPIWNWSRRMKSRPFSVKEIDTYKGIPEDSTYTYAKRASRAMPYFQITDSFISGNVFFEMVEHYLYLLRDVKSEICNNPAFVQIKQCIVCEPKDNKFADNIKSIEDIKSVEDMDSVRHKSTGFRYTVNLFYCALLCYYDRFHNFDELAVKKLFSWAFMLRVDMQVLGFDSINKYAIGEDNSSYSNIVPMFSKIYLARSHNEISSLVIKVHRKQGDWNRIYDLIDLSNRSGEKNE